MKYIAVIDCASSAKMYVDDIIDMGYRPLLIFNYMNPDDAAPSWLANIEDTKNGVGRKADILQLERDDDADSVVRKLESYDLSLVIAGTDSGVRLTDKLNKMLGLRGNDPETTYLRVTKKGMDEALTKAGIRHIMTAEIHSADDVRTFWNTHCTDRAVLKFSESAGTVGLKICNTLEECIDYHHRMLTMHTMVGASDVPILMQEFIGGTEYIVNSLSIDGRHKITDVWRYHKLVQSDGTVVYDYAILVDHLGPGMTEMIRYDYKVLDAVHMENGFCHTEIKIDSKGPVLIETNPRTMGANLTRDYLEELLGNHMTDMILKSLLEPSYFSACMCTPYLPRKYSMIKNVIVPKDVRADLTPFIEVVRNLDSFRGISCEDVNRMQDYVRTVDMETSPAIINLTNADHGRLMQDYELLRSMESMYFDMMFTVDDRTPRSTSHTDLEPLLSSLPVNRRFVALTDDGRFIIRNGVKIRSDQWEVCDGAIYARCAETSVMTRYRDIITTLSQIRKGGLFYITQEAYETLPYGSTGAEVLMNVMGFDVMITSSSSEGVIYGMKR